MSSLEKNKSAILAVLCAALLAASAAAGLRARMHETLPEAVGRHTLSMAVAVSSLSHGLGGYLAYVSVIRVFDRVSADRSLMTDPARLNAVIAEASALPEPAAQGVYPLVREDKGLVVYYKLAFAAFGPRIQSVFWLYFALLGASALCWSLTFGRRPELMALLAIFLGAHLAVTLAAPAVGLDLAAVHNPRFLPVLTVLPALHLALLILGARRREPSVVAAASFQAALLTLVIHARSGSVSQILFLGALFAAAALLRLRGEPELGAHVLAAVRPWPLALAGAGLLLLKLHMAWSLSPVYSDVTAKHLFWHPVYLGLAVLPEAQQRFGFRFGDEAAFAAGKRLALERFGKDFTADYDWDVYETVLKDETFRLASSAPWLTVKNYMYKFPLFARTVLSAPFGAGARLAWLLPLALALSWLAGPQFARAWPGLAGLAAFCWLFSMLPSLLAVPDAYLIAEPAALFLTALLTAAAGAASKLWA